MWIYIWLGVIVLSLMMEFLTADLLSVWFAGGGLLALILSACGLGWYIHFPVFVIVSLVLLLCFRKLAIKVLNKKESKTNADAVIGDEFRLLSSIAFNQVGTIKINGIIWNAVGEKANDEIAEGKIVKVIGIKGNKYIVEEVKQ